MTTKQLVYLALMTGLVAVATLVIQIPSPATEGFVNFGDTFIFVAALLFGPFTAFVAGGVGSAMADVLSGYGHWAPFTLVIKALEGLICAYVFLALQKLSGKRHIAAVTGMGIAALWMVVGYFFAGALLKGSFAVSAVSIPGNIVQGAVSVVAAALLVPSLRKILKQ